MLLSFKLRNSFSFANENILDMRATKIKAHDYSLLGEGNNKVLPVMSIYGANASGKSNLIRSLLYMLELIASGRRIRVWPFMLNEFILDDEPTMPPAFELTFLLNQDEYTFTIMPANGEHYFESLFYRTGAKGRSKLVYKREWNGKAEKWTLKLGTTLTEADKSLIDEISYVDSMERGNKTLLLYALCNRKQHVMFSAIAKWVANFNTSRYAGKNATAGGTLKTHAKNPHLKYFTHENTKKKVLEFVQSLNPHIKDYDFEAMEREAVQGQDTTERYQLFFEYGNQNAFAGKKVMDVDRIISVYESRGVYSAFTLIPTILKALESGGLIVIDEIENSLHPLLMARVVNMFTDPETNIGGGQLIFTTHNALIMDKKYLRQDEIAFVEKNEEGKSELYKLSDIDGVRSDLDFCKNYILGAFGAVPNFE